MSDTTYLVEGMTCTGCTSSLERALREALGAVEVAVELEGGRVRVSGAHEVSAVERAVEDAGFDFKGQLPA